MLLMLCVFGILAIAFPIAFFPLGCVCLFPFISGNETLLVFSPLAMYLLSIEYLVLFDASCLYHLIKALLLKNAPNTDLYLCFPTAVSYFLYCSIKMRSYLFILFSVAVATEIQFLRADAEIPLQRRLAEEEVPINSSFF